MLKIFRKKSITEMIANSEKTDLTRSLTYVDLILMGVGVIVGTGIFVFTGIGAAQYAGPALMLSFVISGATCAFAALAYAELAAMVPIAGSAYTYTYTVLGELIAWIVGWALVLEYSIAAAAVASGWSQYVVSVFGSYLFTIPEQLQKPPGDGGILNLPAVLLVLFLTFVLYRGTKESARLTRILVFVKLAVVFIFIVLAAPHINVANWTPFMPFGIKGVITGASFAFFAYLGFDLIANASEECKNPKRDLPIGILGSLVVVTILYIAVTAIMTGVLPYTELNTGAPITAVLDSIGYRFGSALLGCGIIFGLTAVVLVLLYSQTRLFLAMARDGLLPVYIAKIHPKYKIPSLLTAITGILIAGVVGLVRLEILAELVNIGTLFAFIAASAGVLILRIKSPNAPRPFKCPFPYVITPLAILSCGFLVMNLRPETWHFFIVWVIVGLIIYSFYGYHHSKLGKEN
ncbi:MAG: amino acid permease [Negativicutes bacterium]|jgi:APA family basic amino acid/polyamine antiporter